MSTTEAWKFLVMNMETASVYRGYSPEGRKTQEKGHELQKGNLVAVCALSVGVAVCALRRRIGCALQRRSDCALRCRSGCL